MGARCGSNVSISPSIAFNFEMRARTLAPIRISAFGISFGLRISAFGFPMVPEWIKIVPLQRIVSENGFQIMRETGCTLAQHRLPLHALRQLRALRRKSEKL